MTLSGQSVLLVGPSGWPLPHFKSGVEALGGRLERFLLSYSMARPIWSDGGRNQARLNDELRRYAAAMKPAPRLAIFVTYDDCLEPETLRALRQLGTFTVCYHVDMVMQWYRVLRTGPHFDLVACAQKAHIGALRAHGIRAEYIPMAAAAPEAETAGEPEMVIGYLGGPQPYRLWMLERLGRELPMRYYGRWFPEEDRRRDRAAGFVPDARLSEESENAAGRFHRTVFNACYLPPVLRHSPYVLTERWRRRSFGVTVDALKKDWRGSVPQERMAPAMSRSFMNIGFTYFAGRPGSAGERRQCRLREFEATLHSLHGPYLMQEFPERAGLFSEDEVVVWDGPDDLVPKARELFRDAAAARRIAANGRRAVLTRHLWQHRLQEMLSYRKGA